MRTAELELQYSRINESVVESINLCGALHTLRILVVRGDGRRRYYVKGIAQVLAMLRYSTTLHTLTLDLSPYHNEIGDSGAQALAMLKDSTTLCTLTLNLSSVSSTLIGMTLMTSMSDWRRRTIGDAGAQALAMLKDSMTLRSLTLYLTSNLIGDAGALQPADDGGYDGGYDGDYDGGYGSHHCRPSLST